MKFSEEISYLQKLLQEEKEKSADFESQILSLQQKHEAEVSGLNETIQSRQIEIDSLKDQLAHSGFKLEAAQSQVAEAKQAAKAADIKPVAQPANNPPAKSAQPVQENIDDYAF